MKLVFGFNIEKEVLRQVVAALKKSGITQFDGVVPKRSKSEVAAYVRDNQEDMVVLLVRSLDTGSPYTIEELDSLVLSNEKARFIFIVSEKYMGSDYMQSLYNIGIYDAVFSKDESGFEFKAIVPLLIKPRSKADAKKYYGIDVVRPEHVQQQINEKAAGSFDSVNDLGELVKYIENGPFNEIDTRIEYVKGRTNNQEFIVIMRSLSENTKAELMRKGGYELYYANELAEIIKSSESEQKSTTKIVSKTQYVNVSDAIGVIGLTREAGSTLVAINLARVLADVEGLKPCFIQLPKTDGDVFERFSFADYFGADFVSHYSELMKKGILNPQANAYCKVNFIVENPLVDDVSDWSESDTLKLLLSAPSPKIIDLGSHYRDDIYAGLIPTLKQLVVVVDDTMELTEEDIRTFKDIAVAYPTIKLSFVVNKCVDAGISEAITYIDDEYPFISLPIFSNEEFSIAGCDMLYPNVKRGLIELAELVGYELGGVASAPAKLPKIPQKKEAIKRVTNFTTVEVGLGGVGRGVGTTHTSIMLAMMLKKSYKVAIVEQNDTGAFANLYRKLNPDTAAQQSLIQMFTYKGVDFFPVCNYSSFTMTYRDDYDVVIIDFGLNCLRNDNFLRVNKKIMCASASEWKLYELTRFYDDTRKRMDPNCKITYAIPFIPAGSLGSIRKSCKGSTVLAIPVCMDAFAPSNEACVVLNSLVDFEAPERKKKGFFSKR